MTMVNYYEELGVDSQADLQTLQAAIRENRRRYRSLTGSPNLDQRSMAERKMAILSDAEKIFSDESSRQTYDKELEQELAKESSKPATGPVATDNSDFIELARSTYKTGNMSLAAQFAAEATQLNRQNVEAWKLRATIAQERDLLDEAEMAIKVALDLQAKDAETWGMLGEVHRKQKAYAQALNAYDKAISLSSNPYWKLCKGIVYFNQGQYITMADLYLSVKEHYSGSLLETILSEAADGYFRGGRVDKGLATLQELIKVSPTVENHVLYGEHLPMAQQESYADGISSQFAGNDVFSSFYANAIVGRMFEEYGQNSYLRIDSKAKVEAVKLVLDKLKANNLLSAECTTDISKLQELYKYASTRHFTNAGCFTWIIAILSFVIPHNAIDGFGTLLGFACVALWVLLVFYPYGYTLNKRNGDKK